MKSEKFMHWQFQHALQTAKSIIASGDRVNPIFFAYTEDSFIVIPGMFETDKEKEYFLTKIKLIFAVFKINYYIFIHEGWLSIVPKDSELKIRPKDDPNRKEALVVSCIGHDEKRMVLYEIVEKNNKRVLTDKLESKNEDVCGTFTELLPPKDLVLPEEFKLKVLNHLEELGITLKKREDEVTLSSKDLN